MSRATVVIRTNAEREKIAKWAWGVPFGTRVEFKEIKRSLPQNDRMWAMLTDVSQQLPWHGIKLDAEDWKLVFLDALKREVRMVPNIDGRGFVNLGRSSSDLSMDEMTSLIELIHEFGARHGVTFHEQEARAA
ncbi:recombination protein NinB [Mesorhizobium sp. BR1-1-9]|uniref:recombination protein NinB n=1 Tax=Mesorhizobium sp. BR1-1-9 TaxID=2876646 RepID=UPI001CD15F02|nr:recombination protein NinB [Mesorhizobium sp. BR1-1-9]MBZ9873120.1 recombination protein NinB [Mesorhizobium sp. BR1-1-9]